jgi:hypothetical protein
MPPPSDSVRPAVPPSGAAAGEDPGGPAVADGRPVPGPSPGARRRDRVWSWWAARPTLAAAVVYALLSLVFVGQGLLPGRTLSSADYLWSVVPWQSSRPADVHPLGSNVELADAVVVFHPYFEFAKAAFPEVPLWNPHIMAGRPFLANAQSALFSPFTFPAYVLPLSTALGVIALLKLWVAALGTFVFARAMGLRFGGALLAGIVFAFGTFFVVWLPWPLTNIFPLIPWLLLAVELLVRRPGPLPAAALAALVGLQFFGGHPETSFHVFFVLALFFAFRLVQRTRREGGGARALLRPTLVFGLSLAVGTAVAAVMLLPLLELFFHSGDYLRREDQTPSSMSREFIGALFLGDYWGRPTQTSLAPFLSSRGLYAGAVTLMLAVAALVLRPTATRVGFAVFGCLVLAVVFGVQPLFGLVTALPGFAAAHNARTVIFFLLVLAMLAGWGLDDLTRRTGDERRRRLALAAAGAIFCVPIVWMLVAGTLEPGRLRAGLDLAWGFADRLPAEPGQPPSDATVATVRMSALLQWLPVAGAGLALIALAILGRRSRAGRLVPAGLLVGAIVAVLVVDLFRATMGYNTAIPVDNARPPATGAIRYLESRRPNRFAGFDPQRGIQPLQPDMAMRYGLYDARGYDYPVVRRYDTWWRATAAPSEFFSIPTAEAKQTPRALRGMSLLSVTDIVQDPADPPSRLPGLELAYSGRDARVYRNPGALPRAFLVDRQRVVDGADAALRATLDPRFDARRVAVTERPVAGIPLGAGGGGAPAGTARLVGGDRERVAVRARADRRSLLVLTDVHYPGWKATVDGRPAPIERVDYLLRGVAIPPGTHEVEFSYEPLTWRLGLIVSALASLAVVATAAVGLGRRRRRASGRP